MYTNDYIRKDEEFAMRDDREEYDDLEREIYNCYDETENKCNKYDEREYCEEKENIKNAICNCDGKPVTGYGRKFNAFTTTSPIDFYIYLNDVCTNSLFGLEVEVYFTPDSCDVKDNPGKYPCSSRYLAARVCKAVDVAKLCECHRNKGCCDVRVPFKGVIVLVTCCYKGKFDFVVNGNYLSCPYRIKPCPPKDKLYKE